MKNGYTTLLKLLSLERERAAAVYASSLELEKLKNSEAKYANACAAEAAGSVSRSIFNSSPFARDAAARHAALLRSEAVEAMRGFVAAKDESQRSLSSLVGAGREKRGVEIVIEREEKAEKRRIERSEEGEADDLFCRRQDP